MWQLTLLAALILCGNCHARWRQSSADLTPEEWKFGEEGEMSLAKLIKSLNDIDAQNDFVATLECGRRNWFNTSLDDPRGYPNEAPWLVNINFQHHRCDGSLIHPQVVFTAAHCVDGNSPAFTEVLAGQSDPCCESDSMQRRRVKEIIIHENFDPRNLRKNFAILILQEPFVLNKKVDVLCLLQLDPEYSKPNVITGGWGTMNGEGELNLINDRKVCRDKLDASGSTSIRLEEHMQCAEVVRRPMNCEGTYGMPLAQALSLNSRHYFLIGVLSWNPYCTPSKGPTIWTLLEKNDHAWVRETLRCNGIQF